MVYYFERQHSDCMDRQIIKSHLTELITTDQIDRLPSMESAPSEMKSLTLLAEFWLENETTEDEE